MGCGIPVLTKEILLRIILTTPVVIMLTEILAGRYIPLRPRSHKPSSGNFIIQTKILIAASF